MSATSSASARDLHAYLTPLERRFFDEGETLAESGACPFGLDQAGTGRPAPGFWRRLLGAPNR